MKLTSYFSLCGQWNSFISGQLLGKFLCDLDILSSSKTMRNPSLETKSRQRVSQHRFSSHRQRKCLGGSEHSCGVMPLFLCGTYCSGHSQALTNQNYVFQNDTISMSVKVGGIWDTIIGSGSVRTSKELWTSIGGEPWPGYAWSVWALHMKAQSHDTSTKFTLLLTGYITKRKYRHIYEIVITDRIVFITSGTCNNDNPSKCLLFWIKLLYIDSYFTESYH